MVTLPGVFCCGSLLVMTNHRFAPLPPLPNKVSALESSLFVNSLSRSRFFHFSVSLSQLFDLFFVTENSARENDVTLEEEIMFSASPDIELSTCQ
jgi:hypothetical protein